MCVDNWSLQLDNDLFANSDRDYTNGARFEIGGQLQQGYAYDPLQEQLRKLSGDGSGPRFFDSLTNFEDRAKIEYGWGFGITHFMFTADNPYTQFPPSGERPYAAWLGAEYALYLRDENSISSVALSVGVTGEWAFGEEIQDWVHTNISGSPLYRGWDSQLPEEVTVNLHLDHKRRMRFLDNVRWKKLGLDGYFEFGGSAGTFRTAAYVGGLMRAGWNLPNDYSVPRVQLASYNTRFANPSAVNDNGFSIYLLGGIRGSAVLHDITLDGSLFRDFRFSVDSKPLVGELIGGVGIRFWSLGEVVYSRTLRTDEFYGQNANQEFGSLQYRWRKSF